MDPTQSLYSLRGRSLCSVKGAGLQGQLAGCRSGEGQPQGTFFPENCGLALTPSPGRQPHLGSQKGTFLSPNQQLGLALCPGGFRRVLKL